MDALDVRILRELAWKPTDPLAASRGIQRPWDIARVVGVHGNTVKDRLQNLRDNGVLQGVGCAPRPSVLGMQSAVHRFEWHSTQAKCEGVKILAGSGFVTDGVEFLGTEAWANVFAPEEEDLANRVRILTKAAGADAAEHIYSRGDLPNTPKLRNIDYRIMRALQVDGLRPLSDVAAEVGVTAKTARNRFNAMVDSRAIGMIPFLHLGAAPGVIAHVILMTFNEPVDDAARGRLLALFPNFLSRTLDGGHHGYFRLVAASFAEVEDNLLRVLSDPAVDDANVLFPKDVFLNLEPVRRLLDARLAETATTLRHKGSKS